MQASESTAARRRVFFHLVDATDGITPETGEAGGQPQISTNGAAWTSTGIGTLTAIGNGRYYADLTAAALATAGDNIETRYKSANTAEAVGDGVTVVEYDPISSIANIEESTDLITAPTVPNLSGDDSEIVSGTASYCSAAQFLMRWDHRTVGRLLSRTGTALTQAEILTNDELEEFLLEASGEVEMGVLRGGRYTVAGLLALEETNSGKKLAGLVADLAMWRLWDSRPDLNADRKLPVRLERALIVLGRLESGEAVFGLATAADAGRMEHRHRTPAEVEQNNGVAVQADRYFGKRSDRDYGNRR